MNEKLPSVRVVRLQTWTIPVLLVLAATWLLACHTGTRSTTPTAQHAPAPATTPGSPVLPTGTRPISVSSAATPAATASPTAFPTLLANSPSPGWPSATVTRPPSSTPGSSPSPTPRPVMATITTQVLNVRGGPGTNYPIIGQVLQGERYPILARNAAGTWWRIDFDGVPGWVYAALVEASGDAASVPIMHDLPTPPPPTPTPAVRVYESTITIPTYPYAAFRKQATDPVFNWTFQRFDRQAYEASHPQPAPQTYKLVVLENEYLRLTLLPELGGRLYQVIFKPTGSNEFYQNPVIKPSPWGPPEQGGWLAAGGLEWGLPVEEHGYAWGDPWGYIALPFEPELAGVTVFMPDEGHLRAEVDIMLRAGEAAFTIRPRIVNPTERNVSYKFWLDAMLAPGPANTVGPQLHFLFPAGEVTVHSRGDPNLPGPLQPLSWPLYQGRDLSRLGNWNRWLGFFERPAAHGPYAGVYDEAADEGMIRVFPADIVRGSKGFGLGWTDPIAADNYTDDGSAYVELQGGVAPTFWDQATLAAGDTLTWQETWFPVAGIGGITHAEAAGALHLAGTGSSLQLGLFVVRPVNGRLLVELQDQPVWQETVAVGPAQPLRRTLSLEGWPSAGRLSVTLLDQDGSTVLTYQADLGALR